MPGTQHNSLSNNDPDINLINDNSQSHCNYYNITYFNVEAAKFKDNYISILTTNFRSSNKKPASVDTLYNNLNTNWTLKSHKLGVNRMLLPTIIYRDTVRYMISDLTKLGKGVDLRFST